MSRNSILLSAAALSSMMAVGGCADYLNRFDTVTLAVGDAQKHNLLLQSVDPFNPDAGDVSLETDGMLAVAKYNRYRTPAAAAPAVTVNSGAPTGQ